ncbi:hypothetical protein BC830DRAFT_751718 [Chytriomyces sp. MP71]|nr:hypothetical protein BC830DRAFT_751718 [Chytriomyces sp. MP71]
MKFGKFIQGQQTEWAGPQYLNYKGLKKIINSVEALAESAGKDASANPVDITLLSEFQAFKTAFFFKLERELEKVNAFYLQKESEFRVRLRSLVDKKKVLKGRKSSQNMAALINLQEAFASFQQDLAKLQKFVEVNGEGFRKILKKWDKRAKSTTKELYLSRQVEIQPCFNNDVLTEFTDSATMNIAEIEAYIEHGDFPAVAAAPDMIAAAKIVSPVFGQISESVNDLESELVALLSGSLQPNAHALDSIRDFIEKRKATLQADDNEFFSRVFLRVLATAPTDAISLVISAKVVDCNYVDDINNRTCVHEAAISGRLDVLKLCIELGGGNIETLDVYGRKAMHYAAMYGKEECLSYVLQQANCDIDLPDLDGFTALTYSIIGGFTRCVQLCLEKGAAVDPVTTMTSSSLSLACEHGHTEIATLLLSKGASLVLNSDGMSPLHLAARAGHTDLLALLIKYGGDVDLVDVFQGWTPVFYAASEGHIECVKLLIKSGCSKMIKDETDWNAWTYALYHGHIEEAKLLEIEDLSSSAIKGAAGVAKVIEEIQPMAPSALFTGKMDTSIHVIEDLDLEELPSLSLPPPIIPFRIYGHNYLDNKYLVQVNLSSFTADPVNNTPIKLFGSRQLSSLKLIISNKPDSEIPYNVILPLTDDSEPFTFFVGDLADVSLQFDIYPTFGTKILGRAAVLASQLLNCMGKSGGAENETMIVPLFDSYLRVVGELKFSFSLVNPFIHPRLQIGGKVETYWKSTMVVNTGQTKAHTESGIQSLITASSLVQEYINAVVQLTRDGIPVVFPSWFQRVTDESGSTVNVSVTSLTYKDALKIFKTAKAIAIKESSSEMQTDSGYVSNSDLAGSIYDSFLTLDEVLKNTPTSVGLSIELKYPTQSERDNLSIPHLPSINTFLDSVLKTVYDHSGSRSIIFSSFNPQICVTMNWKQPNFGVFFKTNCGFGAASSTVTTPTGTAIKVKEADRRCGSIKEAIRFAKRSHFLGVMCEATPLIQVPALITTIKQSGLMLASFGPKNQSPQNVTVQESGGVDAIMAGHVLKYSVNPSL